MAREGGGGSFIGLNEQIYPGAPWAAVWGPLSTPTSYTIKNWQTIHCKQLTGISRGGGIRQKYHVPQEKFHENWVWQYDFCFSYTNTDESRLPQFHSNTLKGGGGGGWESLFGVERGRKNERIMGDNCACEMTQGCYKVASERNICENWRRRGEEMNVAGRWLQSALDRALWYIKNLAGI